MCHRVRLGASDGFSSEQRFRLRRRRYGQKNPQRPHHPTNQKLEKIKQCNQTLSIIRYYRTKNVRKIQGSVKVKKD